MNSSVMKKNENQVSKFTKDLKGVNDDWPLLDELSKNKFVLRQNKKNNLNIAKTAKEMIETSLVEDAQMSESAIQDDAIFEKSFVNEANDFKASPEVIKSVVNDVKESEKVEVITHAPIYEEKVQSPILQSVVAEKEKTIINQEVAIPSKSKSTNPLLKLIAIGLTKLYVKKTTSVLNPVKFVAENYRNVLFAILHLGVPFITSWFLITQVEFIKSQLVGVSSVMFWTYAVIFYFASLFVWVTGQVLIAGLLSMFKTTLVSVANEVDDRD